MDDDFEKMTDLAMFTFDHTGNVTSSPPMPLIGNGEAQETPFSNITSVAPLLWTGLLSGEWHFRITNEVAHAYD